MNEAMVKPLILKQCGEYFGDDCWGQLNEFYWEHARFISIIYSTARGL